MRVHPLSIRSARRRRAVLRIVVDVSPSEDQLELVTFTTVSLFGEITAKQSFLASAIAINLFAFACDSA